MPEEIAADGNITATNLWTKEAVSCAADKFTVTIGANDSAIFRIIK